MAQAQVCAFCHHKSERSFMSCPLCGREALPPADAGSAAGQGDVLVCYKCDYETGAALAKCPRCGQRMRTPGWVRAMGAILLAVGLFLVTFMGAIAYFVANIIAHTSDPGATTRFEGGTREIAIIFGVFGLVIAFGVASTVAGLWQLVRGRRNKKLTTAVLVVAVVLAAVAGLVQVLL